MSRASNVRWRRWVGGIAGALVLIKSGAYVVARLFGFAKNEAQARGRDVDLVLGLTGKRKSG